jgi:uncharacterized protein (DUF2384 family)
LQEVFKNGKRAFDGNQEALTAWLHAPLPALGGHRPIELVTTGMGADMVNGHLLQMEFGVL